MNRPAPVSPSHETDIHLALSTYAGALRECGVRRVFGAALLMAGGALVEGIGVLMLVPLTGLLLATSLPVAAESRILRLGAHVGLGGVITAFLVIMVLRAILLARREIVMVWLGGEVVDRLRARLLRSVAQARWACLLQIRLGHLEFAITSDLARVAQGGDRLLRGAMALCQLLVMGCLAANLSWRLTGMAVIVLACGLPLLLRQTRVSLRYGIDVTRRGRQRHEALRTFISGLKLAKVHQAEERYVAEFLSMGVEMREADLAYSRSRINAGQMFQVVAAGLACLLLAVGLEVLHLSPDVLSGLLVLIARMGAAALQLAQSGQTVLTMLPAITHLLALEHRLSQGAQPTIPLMTIPPPAGAAAIRIEAVSYRYAGQERDVLCSLNADIQAGEFVALLGPSGAGKSTLGDVLIGLVSPDSGTVLVDGAALTQEHLATWCRQVGYVPQDPFLFDHSVAANLRWAVPEASDEALWEALEAAEAADFIRALPQGLETRVGERGAHFSGGQRQRLCLARTLLRKPRLLVLDEATNALDLAMEQQVLRKLCRLNRQMTIVMITHRLPEGVPVDRQLVLAGGRL